MKVTLLNNTCRILRDKGEPKIYRESLLLYKVKKELINQGYDVIKKRMQKDGHLYGNETSQYIRSRNMDKPGAFMVYDPNWAVRLMADDFNTGELILNVEREIK